MLPSQVFAGWLVGKLLWMDARGEVYGHGAVSGDPENVTGWSYRCAS